MKLLLYFILGLIFLVITSCSKDEPLLLSNLAESTGSDNYSTNIPEKLNGDVIPAILTLPNLLDVPAIPAYFGTPGQVHLSEDATDIPVEFFMERTAPLCLPASLRTIGDRAFYACKNSVLVIPNGVYEIGNQAFAKGRKGRIYNANLDYDLIFTDYGNLQKIYLPETIKSIGNNALTGILQINSRDSYECTLSDYPMVIIEAEEPPTNFFNAFYTKDDQKYNLLSFF